MRNYALAVTLMFFSALSLAQSSSSTPSATNSFNADFPSGGQLRMHVRSGELHIIGSDENKIQIRYDGNRAEEARKVKVSFKTSGNIGNLEVQGGPRNEFQIEIRIPKNSDLYLRMPAGEAHVNGVLGSKDVELHAGELTMQVGSADEYAIADASILAGDLDAGPFGQSKDGLFRSFHHQGSGKYKLHAHVGAGDLILEQ